MGHIVTLRPLLVLLACLGFGCSGAAEGLGAGEPCLRTAQCGPGLACSGGICTSDLTALAEAGMVPILLDGAVADTGAMMDAGPMVDAGPVVRPDTGPTPTDSGPPPMDSGPPPMPDSGPPPMPDSGPPDAGPMVDTGV